MVPDGGGNPWLLSSIVIGDTGGAWLDSSTCTITVPTSYTQFAYPHALPDPAEQILDGRSDPKMWAQWFREFLTEKLGRFVKHSMQFANYRKLLISRVRCRSGPAKVREWKMKLWKQALCVAV